MKNSWAIKYFFCGKIPGFEILERAGGRTLKRHQMRDKTEICGLICALLWLRIPPPSAPAHSSGGFCFSSQCVCSKLPFFFLAEEESGAEEPAVERAAIEKWINAMGRWIDLKNKDTGIRPDKSVPRAPAGELGDSFFWKEV